MHATCGSLPLCVVTRRCGAANPKQSGSRCQIKGNISLKGERLYHVRGSEFYGRTPIGAREGERPDYARPLDPPATSSNRSGSVRKRGRPTAFCDPKVNRAIAIHVP